ncbi:mitotic checkpoint regulator, MAD2B-interacting-domain-containing protein [Annulohypoxylon truncatum]|uniref:mitotic checkpoint regulator, MAD2B-interacting-domain-containing protein n=1 Tax=Annulohypoxylon truncatum TaxID=327061 RepID=UPI002008548E|nr:mitotic checkpoint regulator, MAD2B-interacting-domain-containing protein [Annulohypoxylon truncatum]KAI1212481.1 mitotic checkpoint regulator, MAD2B-interacting-domain-containing protein [Annulohypoxylon truncatum]
MGLVDYSDSESDSEPVTQLQPQPAPAPSLKAAPAPAPASGKRPFQKVVDRAKPGKILVNLPQSASNRDESKPADGSDAPPAKRARLGGGGGGTFSGFNSFLPPPKNVGKKPAVAGSSSGSAKPAPRPGVNLKTGAAPGFSREANEDGEGGTDETVSRSEDSEPPAKQPSIPAEQKPAEEVKLVGKPLMFRPLSVSRKPNKKGTLGKSATIPKATTTTPKSETTAPTAPPPKEASPPPKKREKISLFSISDEQTTQGNDSVASQNYPSTYEPMFQTSEPTPADEFAAYDAQHATSSSNQPPQTASSTTSSDLSLDALATSMNLSAAARRELFGRGGSASSIPAASRVVNFDTDREYAHNEALRAAGQLQPAYNPVRAIAAAGKHNLRQLVSQAQNQREALEESFAAGKGKRSEAGAQYGWR